MTLADMADSRTVRTAINILAKHGTTLAQVGPIRRNVMNRVGKWLEDDRLLAHETNRYEPGVIEDRHMLGMAMAHAVERALVEKRISGESLETVSKTLVETLILNNGERGALRSFCAEHDHKPPSFLVISPGKTCNLRCVGCYADAGPTAERLDWSTFDQIVQEAKTQWGTRFFVISGGEPFAYRSQGKDLIDMAEKHSDCLFMAYTNSTLIDEEAAGRLGRAGNLWPAISVEGWRERTDARRGEGVFDRVLASMARLRSHQVPFGISLTATKDNAEELFSDAFIDYMYKEQGALFGWVFHYMPIGRSYTLDLMPSPEQRIWMWERLWTIIKEKQHLLIDFWNHGSAADGCLSAGGHGHGGYLYIDWNGAVSPCVFVPYSPVNVKDVFAAGGTMTDIWANPFFGALRGWQHDFQDRHCNELAPCPIRDHYAELRQMLNEYEPDPIDENAEAAMLDPEYAKGMEAYDEAYQALSGPVWQEHYMREPTASAAAAERPAEPLAEPLAEPTDAAR